MEPTIKEIKDGSGQDILVIEASPRPVKDKLYGRAEEAEGILLKLAKGSAAVRGPVGSGRSELISAVFGLVSYGPGAPGLPAGLNALPEGSFKFDTSYWCRLDGVDANFSVFAKRLVRLVTGSDTDRYVPDAGDMLDLLTTTLNRKGCLVVIDAFESVCDASGVVRDPGFEALIARMIDGLDYGRLMVSSLVAPVDHKGRSLTAVTLEGLAEAPALELFKGLGGEEAGGEIIKNLSGNPLAIGIAARNPEKTRGVVTAGGDTVFTALVQAAYASLDEPSKGLLKAAGTFFEPFTVEGLSSIAPGDATETQEGLEELAARGLVAMLTNGYYEVPGPVRDFVAGDTGTDEMKGLNEKAAALYSTQPDNGATGSFDGVQGTLKTVEHMIAAGDASGAATLFLSKGLDELLSRLGHHDYLKGLYGRLTASELSDDGLTSVLLSGLGHALRDTGEYERAREAYEKALAIARATKDVHGEATGLVNLGDLCYYMGDKAAAGRFHEEAAPLVEAAGDDKLSARNAGGRGNALLAAKKPDEATKCFTRAAELSEKAGDKRVLGIWHGNLACAADSDWDYERARNHFNRAIELARETGDKRHESWWTGTLGSMHFELGDIKKALDHLSRAFHLSEKIFYKRGKRHQAAWLNRIYIELGEEAKAEYYLDKFIECSEEKEDEE